MNACYFGNTNLALKLIYSRADINYIDPRDGWAAIHYAARWGKIHIIHALINAGVNINIKTMENDTPLHLACRSNRKDVCIWLMRHRANSQILNIAGKRASEMTMDNDIIYICDNFDEFYVKWKKEREILHKKM